MTRAVGTADEPIERILGVTEADWSAALSHDAAALVLWLGAGTSSRCPTCLPLGDELTRFVLERTCGADVQKRVFAIWRHASKEWPQGPQLGTAPRLETILGAVVKAQKMARSLSYDFMAGFRSLWEAPHNPNHAFVAELLSRGTTVLTTNFDGCIEGALYALHGVKLRDDALVTGLRRDPTGGCKGTICYLHGNALDVDGMRVTAEKLNEGLPRRTQQFLDSVFGAAHGVLVLGYSASDFFDITPYFGAKRSRQFDKCCALYVLHPNGSPSPGVAAMLRPFNSARTRVGDSAEVLERLAKVGASAEVVARLDLLSHGYSPQAYVSDHRDWKASFVHACEEADHRLIEDVIIGSVAYDLGINPAILRDRMPARLSSPDISAHFEPEAFHSMIAGGYMLQGRWRRARHHATLAAIGAHRPEIAVERNLGFLFAWGKHRKASSLALTIPEIKQALDRPDSLDWKPYTSFQNHCRLLISRLLLRISNRLDSVLGPAVDELLACGAALSERGMNLVRTTDQIAVARRFILILSAVIEDARSATDAVPIFELYGQRSRLDGYASAHRDLAIRELLRAKYRDDPQAIVRAVEHAKSAAQISRSIGDRRGERRAHYLEARVAIMKAFHM